MFVVNPAQPVAAQGVEVFRVEDRRQGRPVDRPILLPSLYRLNDDIGRVGNLF
jgi:hypothetical protein